MNPEVSNALCGLGWSIGICAVVLFMAWRKTRKRWPDGHNHASFWGSARRVNDE